MFTGIGLGAALVRFYHDSKEQRERNETVSTALIFGLAASAVFLLILFRLSDGISRLVFGSGSSFGYFFKLIFCSVSLGTICQLLLSYLRAKEQALQYTRYAFLQLILSLSLNIYLIAGRGLGIAGALYSSVITQAVVAAILTVRTLAGFFYYHTVWLAEAPTKPGKAVSSASRMLTHSI